MKKLRLFYNESKDQSVPFVLPALRSYKQNLLFPDDPRKTNTSQFPLLETAENSRTPSKSKNLKNKPNQSPKRGISSGRVTTTPLRPLAPNKAISKNPSIRTNPSKQPFAPSRSTDPGRNRTEHPSKTSKFQKPNETKQDKPVKPISTAPDRMPSLKSPSRSVETPKPGPLVPKRNSEIAKAHSKSPGRSLDNSQEIEKPQRGKPESAKGPIRKPASMYERNAPMTAIMENRRSNSISSVKSVKNGIKSPRIRTNSSGSKVGDFQSIPEYPSKHPSRASATRSLSRKRPKKHSKGSYFNFDSVYFRMSDLSIYPLF